jgi:hypothetical protein
MLLKNQNWGGLLSGRVWRGGERRLSACKHQPILEETKQMKSLTTIVAGSAASILLLNGFAFAQQQPQQQQYQQSQMPQLTTREVRQYMSQIERDINQIVQSGDLSRLRQWTQNNIADNAVLNRTNAIETEGQSRAISSITITKPDLLRLQRFVLSGMSDKLNAVQDFRLNVQLVNVEPVGDSAAMVRSRISERATLAPRQAEFGTRMGQQREFTTGQAPEGQVAEDFGDAQPRGQQRGRPLTRSQQAGLQLEAQATCTHLIERNPDVGRLQIAMGIYDAQTEAQF